MTRQTVLHEIERARAEVAANATYIRDHLPECQSPDGLEPEIGAILDAFDRESTSAREDIETLWRRPDSTVIDRLGSRYRPELTRLDGVIVKLNGVENDGRWGQLSVLLMESAANMIKACRSMHEGLDRLREIAQSGAGSEPPEPSAQGDCDGCEQCFPASAEAAWDARSNMEPVAELVDESHYHVTVLACRACAQRFVSVFTETVDWVDGEDPQYWKILPITRDESAALVRRGDALDEKTLEALGPDRRCLCRDYPKAGPKQLYWSRGLRVGFHD